jgi:hypothetical protein
MLKVDLHLHTGEDPVDGLHYPATAVIDRAVALGFHAIAITLHGRVLEDPRVFDYARERGLLLIRAVERRIQGADVLIYDISQREAQALRTFDDLRAYKRARGEAALMIAPHPCYPGHSLKRELERQIDLFDAIEVTQIHLSWLDAFNRRARDVARRHGKPLVANSDAHNLWMFGRHYTLVDAEPTIASIFAAIRAGRVEAHSPHVSTWACLRMFMFDPLLARRPGRVVTSFPPTREQS